MIEYKRSSTAEELQGILALQKINLPLVLNEQEIAEQGFVTVSHTYEVLKQLNDIEPHAIAVDGKKVVAYLLAMTAASRRDIPILIPMFEIFEQIDYQDKKISDFRYMVVGQVCVDKAYRGKGILDSCYAYYKDQFRNKYDFAITEIALSNKRSLNAHFRIGFKEIVRYTAPDGVGWSVVVWKW